MTKRSGRGGKESQALQEKKKGIKLDSNIFTQTPFPAFHQVLKVKIGSSM